MLKRMNAINQQDEFVQNVVGAIQTEDDEIRAEITQLLNNLFFDTCSEEMLTIYEKEAGIVPLASQTLDDRRASVSAKWKSTGKCDITQLQTIADSWKFGKVSVDFYNSEIVITFIDKGIPADIEGIKFSLEEVKPAHLPIRYIYVYNTWSDISELTWNQCAEYTWEELKVRE